MEKSTHIVFVPPMGTSPIGAAIAARDLAQKTFLPVKYRINDDFYVVTPGLTKTKNGGPDLTPVPV